jgi:hypothetical protein
MTALRHIAVVMTDPGQSIPVPDRYRHGETM